MAHILPSSPFLPLDRIYQFAQVKRCWAESSWYRRALSIALTIAVLRLLMQFFLLTGFLDTTAEAQVSLPDDLRIYLEASSNLRNQQDLYPPLPLERMEFYQYAPSFALVFTPFSWLSPGLTAFLHTVLHVVIYVLLYVWWGRIFQRLDLQSGLEFLAKTLPVWLVFSAFWSDLSFLNVYILMALLSTLLIEAVLSGNLGTSLVWATAIMQIKPQWAFALIVPLFWGQRRFFVRLLLFTTAAYLAVVVFTLLIVGPVYGWKQYSDYFYLLTGIGGNYPWRGPENPFLGYNHSIAQIMIYLFGNTTTMFWLATVLKSLILLPLIGLGFRQLLFREPKTNSQQKLDWIFALYTAAFIWLDVVWELSLAIVVFTYLLATAQNRSIKTLIWAVFLPYALVDVCQVVGYLIFGSEVLVSGLYILTDPSIYLPLTMIVAVVFYGLLVWRLWAIRLIAANH